MSTAALQQAFNFEDPGAWEEAFGNFQKLACSEGAQSDEVNRRGYELACLNDIRQNDLDAFQRHFSRVKQYSTNTTFTTEGKRSIQVCAVHLMLLLSENRLADFHTHLETMPSSLLDNEHIRYVLHVERSLMTGAYSQVLKAKAPDGYGNFLERLYKTVREDIASCLEASYEYISLEGAKNLLMVDSLKEVDGIATERGWEIVNEAIHFKADGRLLDVVNEERIGQHLTYTDMIEAIV